MVSQNNSKSKSKQSKKPERAKSVTKSAKPSKSLQSSRTTKAKASKSSSGFKSSNAAKCRAIKSKSSSKFNASKPTSIRSIASVESIGIGAVNHPPPANAHLRFRLMPEGGLVANPLNVYDQHVFDCLVFVIICAKHGTVALSNPTDWTRTYSYFPFILLPDSFPWGRISRDGLANILGKSDFSDGDAEEIMADLPEYTVTWLNILRLELPRSGKYYTRLTQVIHLLTDEAGDEDAKCCQDSKRIRWLRVADVSQRGRVSNLWGDEVVSLCRGLLDGEYPYLQETDLASCMPSTNVERKLLQQINVNEKAVHELLADYATHLYPAFAMTVNSFRCFLQKYSLLAKFDDKRIERLFKTFAGVAPSVSFEQLLIGLACMDPKASSNSAVRIQFIFRYYDPNNTGSLSTSQTTELIKDIDPNLSESQVRDNVKQLFGGSTGAMNLERFTEVLRNENYTTYVDRLLRLERSYFEARKTTQKLGSLDQGGEVSFKSASTKSKSKSTSQSNFALEGTCFGHAGQKFNYALHAVTMDNSGCCVDPRMICEQWVTKWADLEMTGNRFSMENVFRGDSVANVFINLLIEFKIDSGGLLSSQDDWETLYVHLEMLALQIQAILRHEPKLLRLTSPLLVFGDLQGSLRDLFHLEQHFFRAAPVAGHTLLFLGNYSGSTFSYGFECILFLFALKATMPNKIYLLRGSNEMRLYNESHLKTELLEKYGNDFGEKIFDLINRVFDCLPVAAIIEESILATHSGIPQLPADSKLATALKAEFSSKSEVGDPRADMPVAYEMMVNVPVRYAQDKEEESETKRGSGFAIAKAGNFSYFNRRAFDAFMKTNHLEYLLRSHNPCTDGYAFCFSGRCLTVHSCHQSGDTTMAHIAALLIDNTKRKIRVVRFETANLSWLRKKAT